MTLRIRAPTFRLFQSKRLTMPFDSSSLGLFCCILSCKSVLIPPSLLCLLTKTSQYRAPSSPKAATPSPAPPLRHLPAPVPQKHCFPSHRMQCILSKLPLLVLTPIFTSSLSPRTRAEGDGSGEIGRSSAELVLVGEEGFGAASSLCDCAGDGGIVGVGCGW